MSPKAAATQSPLVMAPQSSSFRSIQPATAIFADPVANAPKRDKPIPWSSGASIDKRAKRFKSVTQACNICRRHKARCDGARPRCGGCASKGKPCGYEGEAGQSRQAAVKARLEALEKLLSALQSKPQEEAQKLLQHIRSADDILSLSRQAIEWSMDTIQDGLSSGSVSYPSSVSRDSSPQTVTHEDALPVSISPDMAARDPDSLIRLIMPKADATRAAVRNFYASSGALFHAFPQTQIDEYCRAVFDRGCRLEVSQRVAICCLCSVAAIGVQYAPTNSMNSVDRSFAPVFYDISRHYFADIIEEQPLEAIKVCAALAMYNIMAKATTGLAYIEAGMSMSQRFAISGPSRPTFLTERKWEEFRIAWRMLLFLSSWLSSTLGYMSGSDDMSFHIVVPQAGLEHDHNTPVGEIAQAEMTKISLLKAQVLRTHLASKILTTDAVESALQVLQAWHETLPPQLLLTNLAQTDWIEQDRRTLFYVHLIYLGAIILVYRRIISQAVQASLTLGAIEDGDVGQPAETSLLSYSYNGMFAAKYTARILGLLLSERGIVQRCWLVIFQAHTSCVVILHTVAQKQLHNLPYSAWAGDMKHAEMCLDTLEYCGTMDPVALSFYDFLSAIYSKLLHIGEPPEGSEKQANLASTPPDFAPFDKPATADDTTLPADYLISTPSEADLKLQEISRSLLGVVCRPWDDPFDVGPERQNNHHSDKMQIEAYDSEGSTVKSDWDCEGKSSFRWDVEAMGIKPDGLGKDCFFIGSEGPSGWSPAVDVEVDSEGAEG